jgi:uncharacterized membrane protein (DUF485 family)
MFIEIVFSIAASYLFFVPIVLLTFTVLKIFLNFMVLIIYESSVLGMVCFCEKHKNVICEEVKTFLMSWV